MVIIIIIAQTIIGVIHHEMKMTPIMVVFKDDDGDRPT